MTLVTPSHLLTLGALGAIGLWVVAFFNGTLDNMNAVIAQGVFPDGRLLRSTYTGYGLLDARLTYLSAFYEVLSNDLSDGPRRLFIDLVFLLSCTGVWTFIESRRRGVRKMALRHPIPFIVLWNAMGAALVQPLYFYSICQSDATLRDATIPLNEAIALFITTVPSMLVFPLFLFAPSWLGYDTWTHHGYIATFLGSPFLMVVICLVCIGLQFPLHGLVSLKDPRRPNADRPWVVAAFLFTGLVSGAVHVYTLVQSVLNPAQDASIARLFFPSPGRVASPVVTDSAQPAAYLILMEGYHLFSQFDWIGVALACVLYVHVLLNKVDGAKEIGHAAEWQRLAYLLVGSAIIGPGATGSVALAVREYRLREEKGGKTKKM
ncbi:hypothetical protein FE257_000870 [Aspergillus nanangensis]|uniref:Uncharacterized protein n=1 Tax=Aspergillus nanangensis TaxID=2582783 RepID=A0AAD4CEC9_ASPNN|nr:hypothetical protein FE257_000870 [Aspergillus nanangensis]